MPTISVGHAVVLTAPIWNQWMQLSGQLNHLNYMEETVMVRSLKARV
jgi:hypothetical protein